jgi:hypothetical protein
MTKGNSKKKAATDSQETAAYGLWMTRGSLWNTLYNTMPKVAMV